VLSPKVKQVGGALVVLLGAGLGLAIGLQWVHWTADQTAATSGAAGATLVLALVFTQHLDTRTKFEPVALGASIGLWLTAVFNMLVLLDIIDVSASTQALISTFVVALVVFVSTLAPRFFTTPVQGPGAGTPGQLP
jgi:hypothetical protein